MDFTVKEEGEESLVENVRWARVRFGSETDDVFGVGTLKKQEATAIDTRVREITVKVSRLSLLLQARSIESSGE